MKIGSFIFYKNIPTFTSWMQRFWTKTIYSHLSTFTGETELGFDQEFEADRLVRFHTFRKTENMDIISWSDDVSEELLKEILREVAGRFEGKTYGYISWLTIFLRFLFQRLGFKDTHKWKILWGWGMTCSELKWHIARKVAGWKTHHDYYRDPIWYPLFRKIGEYNLNTFVPQDLRDIMDEFPECFEVEEE